MTSKFTLDVFFTGDDLDKTIEKGAVEYDSFVEEFTSFPWHEQCDLSYKNLTLPPTITVRNNSENCMLWTSIEGEGNEYTYNMGYRYTKTSKGIFSGKEFTNEEENNTSTNQVKRVLELYMLFFQGDKDGLIAELE